VLPGCNQLSEESVLMSQYRNRLPLLEDRPFMTDGGLETSLIFHEGVDVPYFASYDLLKTDAGRAQIERHYERFATLAREHGVGIVLATPTWRASRDWGRKLGYSDSTLADANRHAVDQLSQFRSKWGDASDADRRRRHDRTARGWVSSRSAYGRRGRAGLPPPAD
jgi:S-methylmethionine-dependent homocysteine/selenocysteine methylase